MAIDLSVDSEEPKRSSVGPLFGICLFQDCLSRSSSVGASLASSSTVAASPASCASLLATCVAAAFQPSLLHKFCNLKSLDFTMSRKPDNLEEEKFVKDMEMNN
ncbi:hypothetical protein HYC85_006308 [Camellia sinensis]|uniref:Uncharacterized protein n=1 Tax=Camellia sinensis TaxID=4442 RepID=A0A7J7HKL9_CAMSI|nr:hypothetical protein HYC85_006308 [Camellia sinensis]